MYREWWVQAIWAGIGMLWARHMLRAPDGGRASLAVVLYLTTGVVLVGMGLLAWAMSGDWGRFG